MSPGRSPCPLCNHSDDNVGPELCSGPSSLQSCYDLAWYLKHEHKEYLQSVKKVEKCLYHCVHNNTTESN